MAEDATETVESIQGSRRPPETQPAWAPETPRVPSPEISPPPPIQYNPVNAEAIFHPDMVPPEEQYQVRETPEWFEYLDPKTGEAIAARKRKIDGTPSMSLITKEYDRNRQDYISERRGHFAVLKDPKTNKEVMWIPAVEGGATTVRLQEGLDLANFKEYIDQAVIERYEANPGELTRQEGIDTIATYVDAISNYQLLSQAGDWRAELVEKNKISQELRARLFLAIAADRCIDMRDTERFLEVFGSLWRKELFKTIWEIEGVKAAVQAMEYPDRFGIPGAYFRSKRNTQPRENLIEKLAGLRSWELGDAFGPPGVIAAQVSGADDVEREKKAKTSVALAGKLFKITGISAFYMGPEDEQGRLIEWDIIQRVFRSPGRIRPINMRDSAFRQAWDRQRFEHGIRPLPQDREFIPPFTFAVIMYMPEYLENGGLGLHGLRPAAETWLRSAALFKGYYPPTLEELYRVSQDPDPQVYDFYYNYAAMVDGANKAAGKLFTATEEESFMKRPLFEPNKAFAEPEKMVLEAIKPYLNLRGGFAYLNRYVYLDRGELPNAAAEEPEKAMARILYLTLRYAETREGQDVFRLNRFGLGWWGRTWGKQQRFWAIEYARMAQAFSQKRARDLEKTLGTGRYQATLGKSLPGFFGEFFDRLGNMTRGGFGW